MCLGIWIVEILLALLQRIVLVELFVVCALRIVPLSSDLCRGTKKLLVQVLKQLVMIATVV